MGRPTHLSLTRIQTLLEQPSAAICHFGGFSIECLAQGRTDAWTEGGRESHRLPPKVEEPLYLLGNTEAELGGNVARPSDFETSSKMTRLQKKKEIFVFLSEEAILFTVVLFPHFFFL